MADEHIASMERNATNAGFSPKRKQMMKVAFSMLVPAMMAHPLNLMIRKARGTRNTYLSYGNHGEERKTPILGILDQIASSSRYWTVISQEKQDDLRDYLNQLLAGINEMNSKNNKDKDLINAIHQMLAALDMAEGGRRHSKAKQTRRRKGRKGKQTRRR
jgi:hypothetical protein